MFIFISVEAGLVAVEVIALGLIWDYWIDSQRYVFPIHNIIVSISFKNASTEMFF